MEEACEVQEQERICPRCQLPYTDYSAISREDGETKICAACGLEQAIEAFQRAMQ